MTDRTSNTSTVGKIVARVLLFAIPLSVAAMPVKKRMLKPRAYFVEVEGNLLEPLDLKAKTLTFGKVEFDQCGAGLVRKAHTLNYSCVLPIPSTAKTSKIQNLVTPSKVTVDFGGTKRDVQMQVSSDARSLTLTTAFDATGIDFEISKFNDDFFAIYNKVALLVISEALHKQPVHIEVLETH